MDEKRCRRGGEAGRVRYRQTRFLNPLARPARLAFLSCNSETPRGSPPNLGCDWSCPTSARRARRAHCRLSSMGTGRGGGPGGTRAQVRGVGSAGPAELRRISRLLVMPCSPPLTPLRKGGKQIARSHRHSSHNKIVCLETVPRARLTPTFHHPRRQLPLAPRRASVRRFRPSRIQPVSKPL